MKVVVKLAHHADGPYPVPSKLVPREVTTPAGERRRKEEEEEEEEEGDEKECY